MGLNLEFDPQEGVHERDGRRMCDEGGELLAVDIKEVAERGGL